MSTHEPVSVALADGTRDGAICAACGVVRGGFIQSGEWPCVDAVATSPQAPRVEWPDMPRNGDARAS